MEDISRRVETLERGLATSALPVIRGGVAPNQVFAGAQPSESDVSRIVFLLGRTLLVLGGAYLLRAFTEAGLVPRPVGAAAGFLYALSWLYVADRAARTKGALTASFHGVASALVAFPLLFEVTTRFKLLSPAAAGAALVVFAGLTLAVAWRRNLAALAWTPSIGVLVTAWAIVMGTRAVAPLTGAIVVVAVSAFWLSDSRGWPILGWVAAGAADLSVLVLTLGAIVEPGRSPVATTIAIQLALFLGFSVAILTRVLREAPDLFDALQAAAVTLVGYGGAVRVAAEASPAWSSVLFVTGLAMAFGLYVAAYQKKDRTAYFLSGSALPLIFLGARAGMSDPTLFFLVLAVVGAALGYRSRRFFATLHASLYLMAAGVTSGLFALGLYTFGAPATVAWPTPTLRALATLVATTLCVRLEAPEEGPQRGKGLPQLAALLILVVGGGGVVLIQVGPLLAGVPGGTFEPAALATVRTFVLAAAALLLCAAGRLKRLSGAAWLVYPVLILSGIKLLIEDFPQGRAQTLFLSLLFYGGALIGATRLGARIPDSI